VIVHDCVKVYENVSMGSVVNDIEITHHSQPNLVNLLLLGFLCKVLNHGM